jgi:hypothetical protein
LKLLSCQLQTNNSLKICARQLWLTATNATDVPSYLDWCDQQPPGKPPPSQSGGVKRAANLSPAAAATAADTALSVPLRHQDERVNAVMGVNIDGAILALATRAWAVTPLLHILLQDICGNLLCCPMQRMWLGATRAAVAIAFHRAATEQDGFAAVIALAHGHSLNFPKAKVLDSEMISN